MPFVSKVRTALAGALLLAAAPLPGVPGASGGGVLALLTPAAARAQEPLRVSGLRFGDDTASIEIPEARVEGSNLSQAQLQALFAGDSSDALADRLAGVSATLVAIPELTVTLSGEYTTQVTRYFDVELRDIANGVIGKATAARSSSTETVSWEDDDGNTSEEESFSATSGPVTAEAVDTAVITRVMGGSGAPNTAGRPTHRLHGPFTISDYRLRQRVSDEESDDELLSVEVTIDSIAGGDFRARQPRAPLANLLGVIDGVQEDFDDLPEEKKRAALISLSDVLSSFDLDETTLRNIAIRTEGRGDGANFTARIESIVFRYLDQQLTLTLGGISVANRPAAGGEVQPDTISISRVGVEELSFAPTIAALDKAALSDLGKGTPKGEKGKGEVENGKSALDEALLAAPTGGRFSAADVRVDVNVAGEEATKPDRLAFSIKAFETTTGGNVADGRARFETALTDLHVTLPETTETEGLRQLRELGYTELTLSAAFKGSWDEAASRLTIDTLSLSGIDVGSITAGGQFGDVGREAYSGDLALVLKALERSSLQELTLTLEDDGLFARFVRQQSAQGAGTEDQIKQQYAALATIGIPAVIGDTPAARTLATAISRFATAAGTLTITAKAREAEGVPLMSLDFGAEPGKLLERFDITTSN